MTRQVKILFCLGTILLITGLITNFTTSIKLDKAEVSKRMVTVEDTYESYKQQVINLNTTRDAIYEEVFSNLYFETLNLTINDCFKRLQDYEQQLDNIKTLVDTLQSNCENVYFPEKEVNNKCQTFQSSYEETVNYFINDIKQVNNYIEEYNVYNQENQTGIAPIQKYNTTKDYIDFNNDKEYVGKEDF